MTNAFLFALAGIGLFVLGLHALVVHAHLLRKILAINVMGSGVFLTLIALAKRSGEAASDPVPHAMVITGIVVTVSATALALALMLKLAGKSGQTVLPDKPGD
jgi:multicomponent Na+:H+ antiporter subunit C